MDTERVGICPFCGNKFQPGASACPTCDLPLLVEHARVGAVTASAPRSEFGSGDLRRVAVAANQAEAEMLEGLLRSEGIPCVVRRSFGSDVPDFLAAGRRDILVPAGGFAAARSLLQLPETTDLPSPSPWAVAAAVLGGLVFIVACVAAIVLLS